MATLNEKPVRLLMRDMLAAMGLTAGQVFTRGQALQWFRANYPNVKSGTIAAHLIRMSTNVATRLQYKPREDGSDDLFVKIDTRDFRLYEPGRDATPISRLMADPDEPGLDEAPETPVATSEFAYEHDLRDYLARNLHILEPSLRLYEDDGIPGIEFPAGGRCIDILAVDPKGDLVVIELKVSRGYERAVGQLLRYMGWIRRFQADAGQSVRGLIVAKNISEDLRLACADQPQIGLFEYRLSVDVQRVPAMPEAVRS